MRRDGVAKKKAGLRRGDESIGISTIKGGPLGKR